jgi:hypothetical protein
MATKKELADEIAAFEEIERIKVEEEKAVLEAAPPKPEVKTLQSAEMRRRNLKSRYNDESQMNIMISPFYRPYFGDSMRIAINGFAVFIPCDGQTRRIAKSFAAEGLRRIAAVDAYVLKRDRRADIANNFETSPGELKIT